MNITFNVHFTASPEFLAAIGNLVGAHPAKQGKLASIPAKTEKVSPPAEEVKEKQGAEIPAASVPTIETIADTVREKLAAGKTKAVKDLLAKFKVPKASQLQEDQYETFYAELKAV